MGCMGVDDEEEKLGLDKLSEARQVSCKHGINNDYNFLALLR
jgi:hypothetical protein